MSGQPLEWKPKTLGAMHRSNALHHTRTCWKQMDINFNELWLRNIVLHLQNTACGWRCRWRCSLCKFSHQFCKLLMTVSANVSYNVSNNWSRNPKILHLVKFLVTKIKWISRMKNEHRSDCYVLDMFRLKIKKYLESQNQNMLLWIPNWSMWTLRKWDSSVVTEPIL